MPTSLVSTGVQFPDNTIQTTAATGGANWTQAGTTLVFSASDQTNGYTAQSTNRGLIYATNNPTTTNFVLATTIPPEHQLSVVISSNQNAGGYPTSYPSTYPTGALGVGATTDYAIAQYFVYDGFTGRYTLNTANQMAGVDYTYCAPAYTTDFITWTPYRNNTAGTSVTHQPSVFNKYTGTRVYTTKQTISGTVSTAIYRVTAANAYNLSATPTTTIGIDDYFGITNGKLYNVRFVDTGSSGTSYFLASISNGSGTWTAKSTDDGVTWTNFVGTGGNNNPGRIVGNDTELMFYIYNQGVRRSTNSGASWGSYDYGSNTQGTSSQYYPTQTAWNGSYWLTIYSGRANYKAMGSGTSWTTLSNFPSGVSSTEWSSAAWNPTLGCWLLIDGRGLLCSNSSSDPSIGTWTVQRVACSGAGSNALQPRLYVVGSTQFNF